MIFMQHMQYNAPNRMYVFQKFLGVKPPDPLLVLGPIIASPPPANILTALPATTIK